jgi:microsomal dipeptidase-like Zn-dependent dipeptidase
MLKFVRSVLVVVLSVVGVAAQPCGGNGERACCIGEKPNVADCLPGLTQIPGCGANCSCTLNGNPTAFSSSGTCVKLSFCGGQGQRSCLAIENATPCIAGLTEVLGCTGDCLGPSGQVSPGMCTILQPISEPTVNLNSSSQSSSNPERSTAIRACPVQGYADNHVHQFAHLAHGGGVLAGEPYDLSGGVNAALQEDYGTTLAMEEYNDSPSPSVSSSSCPNCVKFHLLHDPIDGDAVGSATKDQAATWVGPNVISNSNEGAPVFAGWPQWNSTTHQQVYYKWLERAWQGGLRVITMLAVTNEALCRGNRHLLSYPHGATGGVVGCLASMNSIDEQIQAAYDFQTFIDNKYGGTGTGWFRIVTTPADARAQIAAGNLAVVLGIEMDNLFECRNPAAPHNASCTTANFQYTVAGQVDKYYNMGVRHIFPIHNFDNAFGAAATWYSSIEVGQRVVEGLWWTTQDCSAAGYGFKLTSGFTQFLALIARFPGVFNNPPYPNRPETASCNANGLTDLGKMFIKYLMSKGMLIDVDHLSINSFNDTLTLAEQAKYAGIIATHVLAYDLHQQPNRHERMRTLAQLQRIKNVGGMVSAMLKDDDQDTDNAGKRVTIPYANSLVQDDCRQSSKSFIQEFDYLTDVMGGPVSFGSDFNGIAAHIGPRFGKAGCGTNVGTASFPPDGTLAERSLQYFSVGGTDRQYGLQYPFTLSGFGSFDRQVTGDKTFDFNVDGLAHIGLEPDLVAEMQNFETANRMSLLFRSSEAYIRVWERATNAVPNPGTPSCTPITFQIVNQIAAGGVEINHAATFQFRSRDSDDPSKITYSLDFGDGTPVYSVTGPPIITDSTLGSFTGIEVQHTYTSDNGGNPYTATLRAVGAGMTFAATTIPVTVVDPFKSYSRLNLVFVPSPVTISTPFTFTFRTAQGNTVDLADCSRGGWSGVATSTYTVFGPPGLDVLGPYDEYRVTCTIGPGTWLFLPTTLPPLVYVQVHNSQNLPAYARANLNFIPPTPTGPPTLTIAQGLQLYTTPATSANGALVSWNYFSGVVAKDSNGYLVPTCTPGPGILPIGTTTVNCSATNAKGTTTTSFQVTVTAPPPTLTIPSDITTTATSPAGEAVIFFATSSDAINGTLPVTCLPKSWGAIFPIGTTTETCSATNAANQVTTKTFKVTVNDAPPRITVPADMTVTATSSNGGPATFTATATDFADGTDPVTCQPSSGTVFSFGQNTVTCGATNQAGMSSSKTFHVAVVDAAPKLFIPGNFTLEATGPSGAVLTFTPFSSDFIDNPPPAVTCNPSSGSTLPITYPPTVTTVQCSATNKAGVTASGSFKVTVVDTTPPVLSNVPAPIKVEQSNRAGTPVTVPLPTATDIVDTNPKVTSNAPAVFPLGVTTVTFTATDFSGNKNTATTTVTVVDTTPPAITSLTASPNSLWPPNGKMVTVNLSTVATDICDASPKCKILSVSSNEAVSPVGDWQITGNLTLMLRADRDGNGSGRVYSITVQCTDASGNSSQKVVTVTVPHDQGK